MRKAAEGHFRWRAPANIALIKYWGKVPGPIPQIPQNPSLSMTLSKSYTEMDFSYEFDPGGKAGFHLDFTFEGKPHPQFQKRFDIYLNSLSTVFPFLAQTRLKISSRNSFPHSAGMASSASSMSALALGLCSLENQLLGTLENSAEFFTKASGLARLGSGSACRSLYGGWVLWGRHEDFPGSSNEVGIPLTASSAEIFQRMQNAILVVHSGTKEVSSRDGHQLMENHPFAKARYQLIPQRLKSLVSALEKGDSESFIQLVEGEALMLHGLMMTSTPYVLLWKNQTLTILEKIIDYRKLTGIPMSFTMDAGPNVHLLYPFTYKEKVEKFIGEELLPFCEKGRWISDELGTGPVFGN